jgi:hypothetical protein
MPDHQRVAVGRRLGDGARAERAAGARAVLDHERLAECSAEALGKQPRQHIIAAPGRERHHDGDGARRPALRVSQRDRAGGKDDGKKSGERRASWKL